MASLVVMKLGSLSQKKCASIPECELKTKKEFIRETLYLRWINDKVRLLYKDLDKASYNEMTYEDFFWGDKVKELTSIFKNFEDYEDDTFDPNLIADDVVILSDSDSDSDSENDNLIIFSSDSDSD